MAAERTARRDKYRRWRKRRKYRHWRKRERARAGIEPTAAAPSHPDCPGVSRSDHSAGSKCLYFLLFLQLLSFISSRCSFSCHSPLCPAPVRPGCLFCLFLSLLSPSSQPPNRPCQSERSSKARHEADSFEPAEWSERLTPGQSGWLGVGSIPALALSLFLQWIYFLLFLQCKTYQILFTPSLGRVRRPCRGLEKFFPPVLQRCYGGSFDAQEIVHTSHSINYLL